MPLRKNQIVLFCALCLLISFFPPANAQEKSVRKDSMSLTAEEFLKAVRRAPSGESWALMEGKASHRRSGFRTIESPIRLAIRFTPKRIIAQLQFHGDEIYNLGQTFDTPPVLTQEIFAKNKNKTELSKYGIASADLTLGFLYHKLIAEEKPVSVKGQKCRVFLMETSVPEETAKVYISTEYGFPIKAEWFKGNPLVKKDMIPYRDLELDSVKKENDFWLVTGLKLTGPEWRSQIQFTSRKAGYPHDKSMPSNLFIDITGGVQETEK